MFFYIYFIHRMKQEPDDDVAEKDNDKEIVDKEDSKENLKTDIESEEEKKLKM